MSLKSMPLYGTFWREFYDRPTIIYFLAHPQGEYHFRDVVSLMEISRVFPHGLTQVRFCPIIPGVTAPDSPSPGEGVIILGRPAHFESTFIQTRILENLSPSLRMAFVSDDPEEEGYRDLRNLLIEDEQYTASKERENGMPTRLKDYALVYYGQARTYESEEAAPCLILSGTSTLGTWGASVFATSPYLLERHAGYSPWYQGIVKVELGLPAPSAPFQRHNLSLEVTKSFIRASWVKVVYQGRAAEREWRREVKKFQVFINDRPVAAESDTWRCFIALALEQQERPGQSIQLKEVENRLRRSFDSPALRREEYPVAARLHDLCEKVPSHGVFMERTDPGYRLLLAGFEEAVA